jgi:hypothetical protein
MKLARHARSVVTRNPPLVGVGMSAICVLLLAGVSRGYAHPATIIVTFFTVCLAVGLLAYRAEVDETEVCIRYAPFYTRRTPMKEVTHLVEKRTLVLVTPRAEIPLWGLSFKGREALFRLLPPSIQILAERPGGEDGPAASLRRFLRWTKWSGIGLAISIGLVIQFFQGNRWHEYADSVGKCVMVLCEVLWVLTIWLAGISWVCWSYIRAAKRFDQDYERPKHSRQHKRF